MGKDELENGLALPLMEDFYTLQGEGYHTGEPAYFIRIGGCDVGCSWCDVKESWDAGVWPLTPTDDIISRAQSCPAKAIVITGGEPLMYNLDYLCFGLKRTGFRTFLETSGSHPLSGDWDWICLSPKKYSPPMPEIFQKADEFKVIIQSKGDFIWAEKNLELLRKDCFLYLQPEWSRSEAIMHDIIEYVKEHPKWRVSLQSHKYMRIP
ncbi:MAG: 7-carboxy-7-deazaguanine synthase QueE [Bacteroidetes bacterium]|nr:7-carboxy-7-deazaguanine synthase QueE [Bacteroidota bacterium]